MARPKSVINPVDLGTIMPPEGRLVLGPGANGELTVAALSRRRSEPAARIRVWYESAPRQALTTPFPLVSGKPSRLTVALPPTPSRVSSDTLNVTVEGRIAEKPWRKQIPVTLVQKSQALPRFGATEVKLRYDAPISIRDYKTGAFTTMPYAKGWDTSLKDVVVTLPGGGRYVFWRGACYVPFWAEADGSGVCFEWAEMLPPRPADAVDCVEPLMDKELRYGRVKVIESTSARVHVQWRYQSCDLDYRVWGDEAVEDYYFYPDGFGTRVLTLKSTPDANYELSELILLLPMGRFPLASVPNPQVEALFLDGSGREFQFPGSPEQRESFIKPGPTPAVFRIRPKTSDKATPVVFHPTEKRMPPLIFAPFFDKGLQVTPSYWGSHWPVARGNMTGSVIDERIHVTPHHISLMSWAGQRMDPLRTSTGPMTDALGVVKPMTTQTWTWMIGHTSESDDSLRARARSYASPPGVSVSGGRLELEGWSAERRSIRLIAEKPTVTLTVTPVAECVNPVFEINGSHPKLTRVELDGVTLKPGKWAWDGKTLWMDVTLRGKTDVKLAFAR